MQPAPLTTADGWTLAGTTRARPCATPRRLSKAFKPSLNVLVLVHEVVRRFFWAPYRDLGAPQTCPQCFLNFEQQIFLNSVLRWPQEPGPWSAILRRCFTPAECEMDSSERSVPQQNRERRLQIARRLYRALVAQDPDRVISLRNGLGRVVARHDLRFDQKAAGEGARDVPLSLGSPTNNSAT